MKLGQIQLLTAVKRTDYGMYLADPSISSSYEAESSRVLLPKNQVPSSLKIGDQIQVFLYKDSEDRIIATTSAPALTLHELAVLPVKEVTQIGAFLSWGLAKDLLLPFKEQTRRVKTGEYVLVSLYIDKSERLCATMKVYPYLKTNAPYHTGDSVSGIVYELSDNFGAFVAVDNRYSALIPKKELFRRLAPGEKIEARVTAVKADGKLDLSIREKSYLQIHTDTETVYEKLVAAGGFLPFHDKSDAADILAEFSLSKNAFKRAIGHLWKEGKIDLLENGIQLKK